MLLTKSYLIQIPKSEYKLIEILTVFDKFLSFLTIMNIIFSKQEKIDSSINLCSKLSNFIIKNILILSCYKSLTKFYLLHGQCKPK